MIELENKYGLMIHELIKYFSEVQRDGEVWIETSPNLTSPMRAIHKLNRNDILLTPFVSEESK